MLPVALPAGAPRSAILVGEFLEPQTGAPTVNGLTGGLLSTNPNGVNPRRLDRVPSDICHLQ